MLPTIKGYHIEAEIGSGSAGTVFAAKMDDGERVAIKVFDIMASNPALIKNRMQRVIDFGAQSATVTITAESLLSRPSYLVMPLIADVVTEENTFFVPKTLQIYLAEHTRTNKGWLFVKQLANRLAVLHAARVAHGNLKPGNIFLDADGDPLLSDYASGLMPEVLNLGFSDALLYAAPEQLRNPDGYLEEAGYRWDVYAFGVLAFRLLSGQFPRCQSIFQDACEQSEGLEADHDGIAAGLEESELLDWPDESADEKEERYRELIDFCLMLDPQGRPADMREVARTMERIDENADAADERKNLVNLRKRAERRRAIAASITTIITVVALCLAGMWVWTQLKRDSEAALAEEKFTDYRNDAEATTFSLEGDVEIARRAESDSKKLSESLRESLANEQRNAFSELHSAQVTNEMLYNWILEKGVVGIPTLEGREGRLKVLVKEMQKQLLGLGKRSGLEKQTALLRLRLAEVHLAAGDEEKGVAALKLAITEGGDNLSEAESIRANLRLLLLLSERKKDLNLEALNRIEGLIAETWNEDEDEAFRYSAAVNLIKGRHAEMSGLSSDAMGFYAETLSSFEKLAARYPETPALRMGLGLAYKEAAVVSELLNDPNNTTDLCSKAAAAFLKLASDSKTVSPELKFQIASASAAQSVAAWQNGKSFTAEKLAKEGVVKFTALQTEMPHDFRVTIALASQQGIIATVMRDEGRSTAAAELLDKSINSLVVGLKKESSNWSARYLLASLKWQLSGIKSQRGESLEGLRLGTEARDQLRLILDAGARSPHPDKVKVSLAYLCGDLGLAADLAGKSIVGVAFLKESRKTWEQVLASQPKSTEAHDGLGWIRERLREMGVK